MNCVTDDDLDNVFKMQFKQIAADSREAALNEEAERPPMSEGRPGDHPVLDLLIHHRSLYSEQVDALIIECRSRWPSGRMSVLARSYVSIFPWGGEDHCAPQGITGYNLSHVGPEYRDYLRIHDMPIHRVDPCMPE